jgi:putative flippase GtrA
MQHMELVSRLALCNSVIVRQFVKYCLVGILNTLITLGTIFILMKIFNVNYVVSNVVGYGLGLANSFVWNKKWTFRSRGPFRKESIAFLLVFAVSYLLQLGALVFLKEACKLYVDIAQILSMVFFSVVNFLGNKYISFASPDRQEH